MKMPYLLFYKPQSLISDATVSVLHLLKWYTNLSDALNYATFYCTRVSTEAQ